MFLILPKNATTLSRELLYTGLTRFRQKMVLLIERDTAVLEKLRNPQCSDTLLRNTNMFVLAVRPESVEPLLRRTPDPPHPPSTQHPHGILVRSKSEVIVAEIADQPGDQLRVRAEAPFQGRPERLQAAGLHGELRGRHVLLGTPGNAARSRRTRKRWDRKRQWYEDNGFLDRVITSEDGPDGSIDAAEIERIARKKILLEG